MPNWTRMMKRRAAFAAIVVALTLLTGDASSRSAYAQLTGGDPNHPVTILTQGIRHYRTQDYEAAVAAFTQLTQLDVRHGAAFYYLGLSNAKLGRHAVSLRALERATHLGHDPLALPKDAELATALENEEFRRGIDRLVQIEKRRQQGVIVPFEFHLAGLDQNDTEYDLQEHRGRFLAVVFYDLDDQKGVEALYAIEPIVAEFEEVDAVASVKITAKSIDMQQRRMARLHRDSLLEYTMVVGSSEHRDQLRPFRTYPTLVVVDAEGKAQRIVEGLPADWQERYRKAIDETLHPPAPPQKDEPAKKEEPPKEAPTPPKKSG